jgi:hypothetical protein
MEDLEKELEKFFDDLEKFKQSCLDEIQGFYSRAVKPAFEELKQELFKHKKFLVMLTGPIDVNNGVVTYLNVTSDTGREDFTYPIMVKITYYDGVVWVPLRVNEAITGDKKDIPIKRVTKDMFIEDFMRAYAGFLTSSESLSNFRIDLPG